MSSALTLSWSGGSSVSRVGGADVGQITPGKHEHHPPVDRTGEGDGFPVVEPGAVHHDVNALGRLQQRRRPGVLQPSHPIGPGAGRIDHHARPDDPALARQPILQLGAYHPAGGPLQSSDRHVVGHQRTMMRSAERAVAITSRASSHWAS